MDEQEFYMLLFLGGMIIVGVLLNDSDNWCCWRRTIPHYSVDHHGNKGLDSRTCSQCGTRWAVPWQY